MNEKSSHAVPELPELNISIFAFLLNFVWEIFQIRFFLGMEESRHRDAVLACTQATLGDVGIALVAFWIVAWFSGRGRSWMLWPTRTQVLGFVGLGILATIVFEILATRVWNRWSYGEVMPIIPILGLGLVPLLQWAALPPLIVWFVQRHLRSSPR